MADWLPKLSSIDDPIANDHWSYKLPDGTERMSRVTIGRPTLIPGDTNANWYCPMFFEHVTPEIVCVVGVGPVDALMNAMKFVWDRFQELDEVSPRTQPVR